MLVKNWRKSCKTTEYWSIETKWQKKYCMPVNKSNNKKFPRALWRVCCVYSLITLSIYNKILGEKIYIHEKLFSEYWNFLFKIKKRMKLNGHQHYGTNGILIIRDGIDKHLHVLWCVENIKGSKEEKIEAHIWHTTPIFTWFLIFIRMNTKLETSFGEIIHCFYSWIRVEKQSTRSSVKLDCLSLQ